MNRICVIGSLNVDMTIRLPRFHEPGETIAGEAFNTYAGGKGGNQAVAASRLGAEVLMVGKLGDDANGAFYGQVLCENGVDASAVEIVPGVPSGVALIEVDARGENRIAIVEGTNGLVDQIQVERLLPVLQTYDIFLFQFEIPMDTVVFAAKALHAMGKTVIVDPAPAAALPQDLLQSVDYLTPNEKELEQLTGMPTRTTAQVVEAARSLLDRGARHVLAKMGAKGAILVQRDVFLEVPGYCVPVVDTTAAGDSFNAGFAWALSCGKTQAEAVRIANAVGALSTTGAGAQQAMPTAEEVDLLIRSMPNQGK